MPAARSELARTVKREETDNFRHAIYQGQEQQQEVRLSQTPNAAMYAATSAKQEKQPDNKNKLII